MASIQNVNYAIEKKCIKAACVGVHVWETQTWDQERYLICAEKHRLMIQAEKYKLRAEAGNNKLRATT